MFKKIAFLKLCCAGDILFTTPAVRAVRQSFPDSKLYYLTGKYSSFVPEHNPHIDKVINVQPPFEIKGLLSPARSIINGISAIAGNKFDLVISFHRSKAVASMAYFGRAGKVLGFDTARPMVHISAKFESDRNEILRYLDLVAAIGANPNGLSMEYRTTSSEDEEAAKMLLENRISEPFAVIAPGGGENPGTIMHIKRWPAGQFETAADYIRSKHGLKIVAVGSKSEFELGEQIKPDSNLAGKTSFPLLAAILKKSSLMIANDSGPLHLASAVGAKTVGIYGPTSPKHLAPLADLHRSVVNPICCHPCHHPDKAARGLVKCPTGTWDCMLKLEIAKVYSAIDELMAGKN